MEVKIISVEQVPAGSKRLRQLRSNWRYYPMQVITTDKGEFIDHEKGGRGHWLGREYRINETYEFEYMVNNNNRKVALDSEPVATDNIWLKPLAKESK